MDKMQAGQVMEPGNEALPTIPLDGRRLLGNPDAPFFDVADEAGIKRLEALEQVRSQWQSAGLAGVLSLLVLVAAWSAFHYGVIRQPAMPQWWPPAALLLGLVGSVSWLLARHVVISPFRLLRWRIEGALWGAAALLTWGFGLGQLLVLSWSANTPLLVSATGLTAALLMTATVQWLPGLLLGWTALLGGQLWALPTTALQPDGLLVLLLGFDLMLLALCMVLGQSVRQSASRTVAERMSRRELAKLKAKMVDQTKRLSSEAGSSHDVELALSEARSAADVANRAKTEFLATMSHEVRTPLNGIVPILEMLRETRLDETQQEFLDTAYNSARHLLRIINDVLDFAKAESGKLELESIEIELRDLMESVNDLMGKSAERRGLKLHYKVADDVPRRVRGDPIRLRQVLTNLVSNAIKFTSKGEIRVEVHKRRASRKEVELVFSITDTGDGMSRETQRGLFRAFNQADASTTRKHGGTGLGLVICKRLVQLMGGRIGVKSQLGKGSTFWFVLPMRKSANDVPPARRDLTGLRVLTLVDDKAVGDKLSGVLSDWHMTEERVENSLAGINKIKSNAQLGKSWSYDLLIMALSGSRQSFQALVDEVRSEPALAKMKIVAATPSSEVLRELQKLPGVFAMEAPIDYRLLQRQLNRQFDVEGNRFQSDEDTDALFDSLALDFEPRGGMLDVSHPVVRGAVVARALLVEDNPVNLSVARRMLAKLGIDTVVARDGQEAIDMAANERVDLAIMDCQMPNMDGYEATRRIRAAEQLAEPPRHLPIIAMTANVMSGDREKCLAAGMDDYLGKPLEFAPLRRALAPWVRLRQQGNALQQSHGVSDAGGSLHVSGEQVVLAGRGLVEETSSEAVSEADGPLDLIKLGELRSFMGDELRTLIGQFLEAAPRQLETLARAVQEKDLGAMVLPAHSLKSSSANLGAQQLSRLAAQLEQAARAGEEKAAYRLHHKLGPALKAAVAALQEQGDASDT